MLLRAWFYLSGYVIIMVKGTDVDGFLSSLAKERIHVWETGKPSGNVLIARIQAGAFGRLRPIVRRHRVTVEIVRKVGLPFLVGRILSRKILLVGLVASLSVVYFISSYVWFVRVEGLQTISEEIVLECVREAGLSPGAPRARVNTDTVVHHLMTQVDKLAWAGVEIRGTLALVKVVEKVIPPVEENKPGDLVAKVGGIISHIIPFAGDVLVSEGQTVSKGQVLISGDLPGATIGPDGREMPPMKVRASGIVKARTWYEAYGEASHRVVYRERTGSSKRVLEVQVGNLRFTLGRKPPFTDFVVEEKVSTLHWQQTELPVRVVEKIYFETVKFEELITPGEAERIAVDRAWDELAELLPTGAVVADRQVTVMPVEEEGLTRAKVLVEVIEDIGEFQPFAGNSDSSEEETGQI